MEENSWSHFFWKKNTKQSDNIEVYIENIQYNAQNKLKLN